MKALTLNYMDTFTGDTPVKATFSHITRIFRVVCEGELLYKAVMDETTTTEYIANIFKTFEQEWREKCQN